jgi:hypothetical protein
MHAFYLSVSLQVNTNGVLSFRSGFTRFTPVSFSTTQRVLIAPFWDDVQTNISGSIYYRISTAGAEFPKLQDIISTAFNTTGFAIRELVVATYHEVAKFQGLPNEVPIE